ncbi:MAG: suppressor of fused domain protein [Pirellulales bacterium]
MSDDNILLTDISPHGKVQAVVEDDGRTIYFYLNFVEQAQHPDTKIKSCWVRNRLPAPDDYESQNAQSDRGMLLPGEYCVDRESGEPLDPRTLRIVWFEEGDGAALLDDDDVLAVIPAWSGLIGDFVGYARDCAKESLLCWPLPTAETVQERIDRAEEFWDEWLDENYWTRIRDAQVEAWEKLLGPSTKYYAIDGGLWPPKALLRFDRPDRFVLTTIGVSLLPQPGVEMAYEDPRPRRRVEFAAAFDRSCPEEELKRLAGWISAQSALPWHYFTFLGDGHTMPCEATPATFGGDAFPCVLFVSDASDAPRPALPDMRGDPVNVLWCVPITAEERTFAEEHGSAELWTRLQAAGLGVTIRQRQPM